MLNPILKTQSQISSIVKNNPMQQLFATQDYQWEEIKTKEEEDDK